MPATGAFKLVIRQGPKPNQTFELDKEVYSIGREVGNELVVEDAQVSRRHARLTQQGNSYLLEDLGSTNGTFVNGSRVTAPVLLANGDLIGLADTVVIAVQAPVAVVDAGATFVGHTTDAEATSVAGGPPPTLPSFTPPQPVKQAPPPKPQPTTYAPPPSTYPPPPPTPAAPASDSRRMIMIGCGCLVLLAVVALIGLVAWSFIDCKSFSSIFSFLFPPFQC
jgi:predicted component of type VI protein secretion system